MILRLKKDGDKYSLEFDPQTVEQLGLSDGAALHSQINNGSIILTPASQSEIDQPTLDSAIDNVVQNRNNVLKKLAE